MLTLTLTRHIKKYIFQGTIKNIGLDQIIELMPFIWIYVQYQVEDNLKST